MDSPKSDPKCVQTCLCLWSTDSPVINLQHHLQVFTLTPHPPLHGFHCVSFSFLNKTQKRTAMFRSGRAHSLLFSPPSHSSHLCWWLAGRKIQLSKEIMTNQVSLFSLIQLSVPFLRFTSLSVWQLQVPVSFPLSCTQSKTGRAKWPKHDTAGTQKGEKERGKL